MGRLKTETWTDKQGQTRKSVKIVADQVNRVKPYVGVSSIPHSECYSVNTKVSAFCIV